MILTNIQTMMNKFMCYGRHPSTRTAVLQLSVSRRGLDAPNLILYYSAALQENMAQWWNPLSRLSWDLEPCGMEVPLSEEIWYELDLVKTASKSPVCKALNCYGLEKGLRPFGTCIIPLASFLWHPKFRIAVCCSNFWLWEQMGLVQFHTVCHNGQMYSYGKCIPYNRLNKKKGYCSEICFSIYPSKECDGSFRFPI